MPEQSNQSAFSTDVDVLFAGSEISDDEIISFVVERDFGQPDMAVITLRNDSHAQSKDRKPGDEVEVKVGAASEEGGKASIFKGEIAAIEPQSKAQGDSRVVIRAFHKCHRMLRAKKSKTFQSMSDQDAVSSLLGAYGLSGKMGSDPKITHDHIYQHNQSDMAFARVRAARLGFEIWCDGNDFNMDAPKLDVDSGIELKLEEAGEHHLKSFHARLSAANVLKKVTVRGWDPKKKEEIVGDASAASTPLASTNAASAAGDLGKTETFTVDHPIFSVEEAKAIAKSKLGEGNMTYITAEAECRGHSAYKVGIVVKVIVVAGIADYRFNGKYLVRGVTHKYTHQGGSGASGGFVSVLRLARDGEKP